MRQPSLYVRQGFNPVNLGVLLVGTIVLLGLMLWLRTPSAPSADSRAEASEYRLSHDSVTLAGTHERLFVLERWHAGEGASANILVVNGEDATSRWMFPDNTQTILKRDELHGSDSGSSWSPVTGLVLTVATSAGESLYYYRVDGGPAVRFLTADAVISGDQVSSDRYLVLARHGAKVSASVYSLVDFHVVTEKAAPDVPQ